MSTLRVVKPAMGGKQSLSRTTNQKVAIGFDAGRVNVERAGNDLVFQFDDGAETRITNFFVTDGRQLPNVVLEDGTEVSSVDILKQLNNSMDLQTAAGLGAGEYADDQGARLDGVGRPGSHHSGYEAPPCTFDDILSESTAAFAEDLFSINAGSANAIHADANGGGVYTQVVWSVDPATGTLIATAEGQTILTVSLPKKDAGGNIIRTQDDGDIRSDEYRHDGVVLNQSDESGSHVIIGTDGDEFIYASDVDDIIYGGAGDDTIYGGAGNDIIYGGKGDDIMFGDAGSDIFAWASGEYGSTDKIMDFTLREDRLSFEGLFGSSQNNIGIADILAALEDGRIDLTAMDATNLLITVNSSGSGSSQTVQVTLEDSSLTASQVVAFQDSHDANPASDAEKAALLQHMLTSITG